MTSGFWERRWTAVERELTRLEHDIREAEPNLKWRIGHQVDHDIFPLRVYASAELGNGESAIEAVEMALDCKWENDRVRVTSDIFLSDGTIMVSGSDVLEPEGTTDQLAWVEQQVAAAIEFFHNNTDAVKSCVLGK